MTNCIIILQRPSNHLELLVDQSEMMTQTQKDDRVVALQSGAYGPDNQSHFFLQSSRTVRSIGLEIF